MNRTLVTTAEQDAVLDYAAKRFGLADADAYIEKWLGKHLSERVGHMLNDRNAKHLKRFQKLPKGRRDAIQAELDAVNLS